MTSVRQEVTWNLPALLHRETVQRWLGEMPDGVGAVLVRMGGAGCKAAPNASAALQSALCLLQRRGVDVRFTFPDSTFEEGRLRRLFESARVPAAGSGPLQAGQGSRTETEKTFAYRLPGLVLAQLCDSEEPGGWLERVRVAQSQLVSANGSVFGSGKDRALAVLGSSDERTRLSATPVARLRKLESLLLRLLSTPKYHPHGRRTAFTQLVEFVYQATENTFDHARRDFDGERIRQVRLVSLERFTVGDGAGARPIDKLAPDAASPTATYLRQVEQWTRRAGGDSSRMQLLAVTVADGGVGIAGKMTGGFDVYSGDLQVEFKQVQEAVLPEGTTKPPGEPGRGAGLKKMMRACSSLNGMFELRTGRLMLHRSYLDDDGGAQRASFSSRESAAFTLEGADRERQMLAGTTVSMLVPMIDLSGRSGGRRVGDE